MTPLRESPAFARVWFGSSITAIGTQVTTVAIGFHVYELSHSTWAVGLVGGIALLPMILAGLYGGMLADALDRRLVAVIATVIAWASTIVITIAAWSGAETLLLLYVFATINAAAGTVAGAAESALIPRLVRPGLIPAATALSGITQGLAVTVGPAVAGVLIATVGFAPTYTVDAVLFTASFLGLISVPKSARSATGSWPGISSVVEGVAYVRQNPRIGATFLVDIIAMAFGQPRVLFPAIATVLLHGNAATVGILTAATAVGALLSGAFSGWFGGVRRQGVAVGWSVAVYGAAILGFGAVITAAQLTSISATVVLVLAAVVLAVAGGADNVSAIFRETILQTAPPDHMRGRLQGVFTMSVLGAPRLGDLVAGGLAVLGLAAPPLLGGAMILVLTALILRAVPSFRTYHAAVHA